MQIETTIVSNVDVHTGAFCKDFGSGVLGALFEFQRGFLKEKFVADRGKVVIAQQSRILVISNLTECFGHRFVGRSSSSSSSSLLVDLLVVGVITQRRIDTVGLAVTQNILGESDRSGYTTINSIIARLCPEVGIRQSHDVAPFLPVISYTGLHILCKGPILAVCSLCVK